MRILLIEDNPGDARLVGLTLAGGHHSGYELATVTTLNAAKQHLHESQVDVVLCDLDLPDSWGLETLTKLLPHSQDSAVVVLTGLGDEELGARAIQRGAQDYLVKDAITPALLGRALRYAIERRSYRERLEHQAIHDALTGLPNRHYLERHFDRALTYARENHTTLAFAYLDVDRFKNINDRLGHVVGDDLLVKVAGRLRNTICSRDLVVRMGGDEFAFLLFDADETSATRVIERIQAAFQVHYPHEGRRYNLDCSIGVAFYPKDGHDFTELFRQADQAMYRAKQRGGGVAFYEAEADHNLQERLWLEEELRHALEKGLFELHYQPIYDLNSGTLVKAEALLRWSHPERGMISPGKFIPVAEECGLIADLDHWVLRTAVRQAQEGGFAVAVNLSPQTLKDPSLPRYMTSCLQDAGLETERLFLEITEQVLAHPKETLSTLTTLDQLGIRIAVDDFGTGYSSLTYLSRYPLDILKVDGSFVQTMEEDPKSRIITRTIINLAQNLGLATIAEGIETQAQLDWLKEQGCDMGQGYLLAKPQPLEAIREFTKTGMAIGESSAF